MMDLRANTAVDVLIGPFVDGTNQKDTEEGESPTVLLSKNGQTLAAKNDATTPVHDDAGYYNCELDATDTNTEGQLVLVVEDSANAMPVRHEYNILSEAAWDSLYAPKDSGFIDVNVATMSVASITGAAFSTGALNGRGDWITMRTSGTSDSGTTTTMVDAARTEADDHWKHSWIRFTGGFGHADNNGATRLITGFDADSNTLTFDPPTLQPIGLDNYEILPAARVDLLSKIHRLSRLIFMRGQG